MKKNDTFTVIAKNSGDKKMAKELSGFLNWWWNDFLERWSSKIDGDCGDYTFSENPTKDNLKTMLYELGGEVLIRQMKLKAKR